MNIENECVELRGVACKEGGIGFTAYLLNTQGFMCLWRESGWFRTEPSTAGTLYSSFPRDSDSAIPEDNTGTRIASA